MVTTTPPEDDAAAAWARTEAALDELLALPAAERDGAVARLAAGDAVLAAELRSLLASAARAATDDSLLDRPAAELLARAAMAEPGLAPGTRLGAWAIVDSLGRGGMGQVYRGRRADGQFEQAVAIKVARADSAAAWQRFPLERQIVARLDHPGIAHLIDGGITGSGQPYMVMELVSGQPITRWCSEHACSLAQRLDLFAAICDAVAYAHRHLVIHRDIKPANVMVSDDGRIKLLDFGIARLLDEVGAATTAELMLTPAYCSPEQLSGEPLSTATDVYALGLLLHELLTGAGAQKVEHLPMAAAIHAVLHTQPRPPSSVARAAARAPVAAAQLEGDLDAIVAKALRKEPGQRYPTVDALAADLARHRAHQPVQARRGSWAYTVGRALRRHRTVAVAGAVAAAALVGGTAAVAWQAGLARDEARRATAVQDFLLSLFRANTPELARGHAVTAQDLLTRGAARLDSELGGQPLALALLHTELGDILTDMGQPAVALSHLDKALAGYRAQGMERSAEGLRALYFHANALWLRGELAAAEREYRQCIAWEPGLGRHRPLAVRLRQRLAYVLYAQDRFDESLRVSADALAQPVGDDIDDDRARRLAVRHVQGLVYAEQGRFEEALRVERAVIEDADHTPGLALESRLNYRQALARTLFIMGRYAQAMQEAQQALPEAVRSFGAGGDITLKMRQVVIQSLAGLGRFGAATEMAQADLDLRRASGMNDAQAVATSLGIVAHLQLRAGRYAQALPALREVLAVEDRHHAQPTLDGEFYRRLVGVALLGTGDIAAGTRQIEAAHDRLQTLAGAKDTPDWAATLEVLAAARRLSGDRPAALRLLDEACALFNKSPGPASPVTLRCEAQRSWIAALLSPHDAVLRGDHAQAARRYAQALTADHPALADLAMMEVELDDAGGRGSAAARQAAIARWQAALQVPWPGRLVLLH